MGLIRSTVLIVLLSLGAARAENYDRCGGDGPMPLSIVSVSPAEQPIKTNGTVQDFQVWENHREMVYRNDSNVIYRVGFDSNDGGRYVMDGKGPLTHFAEPQERYLLTDVGSWFFDARRGERWIQYNTNEQTMEPVFWDGNDLYTIGSTFDLGGGQWLKVYRYHAGDDYSVRMCDPMHFDPDHGYSIASGHSFPYVYLYQTTSLSQGTLLNLFRLNVLTCDVEQVPTFKHLVQGPVQAVYRFEKQGAVAVKIDHPTLNLMWDMGGGNCKLFNINNLPPIVLNPNLPVLATWSQYEPGITLYDFSAPDTAAHKTSLQTSGTTMMTGLGEKDLYLTNDGQRLFVRTSLNGGRDTAMMRIAIPGFLPDETTN